MEMKRRLLAISPALLTLSSNSMWPRVRVSVDKDDRTVVFTTGTPDDLDGAMATFAGAAEALAVAQFVNTHGLPSTVPLIAQDRRRTTRT